jgi:hypothetical protein
METRDMENGDRWKEAKPSSTKPYNWTMEIDEKKQNLQALNPTIGQWR